MLATTLVPWTCEMSMHSIRSGASGRSSASCSSARARLRAVRSLARRTRCRAKASLALRSTVSSRLRLSPRCGTRRLTRLPRSSLSSSSYTSASSGSSGTSTSLGTASPASPTHRLLLHGPPERAEVVAEPGGLLILHRLGGGGHLAFEALDHLVGAAG